MYRCKHARHNAVHKHTKSKILISLLAMALVCCVSVSGTLAWIMRQTDPVVNTFTYGDINITLTETDAVQDGSHYTNQYSMVPNIDIIKDPVVTVLPGSEDCWLFVQLTESDNFDTFMRYEKAEGWDKLHLSQSTTGSSVYYRTVEHKDAEQQFYILKDNTVHVHSTVTKEMLNQLDDPSKYPTLTVTAYAVQQEGITEGITDRDDRALEAWALIESEYLD